MSCAPDAWFGQPLAGPDDPWSFYSSEQVDGSKAYDDFSAVSGRIDRITFWGLSLSPIGSHFVACDTEPSPTFLIEFYQPGPVPGALVASYTATVTGVPTGDEYFGFVGYQYDMAIDPPLDGLPDGWISIQGQSAASGNCYFLWGSSLTGNFNALQDVGAGPEAVDPPDNLAFCIHTIYTPVYGACCDEPSATCTENTDLINCRGPDQRFIEGGTCSDFSPACGQILGACCYEDGTCALVPQYLCRPKYPGDLNCDGNIDFADIDPFVLALSGPDGYYAQFPDCNWLDGDCNGDGAVDFADIDAFVALLFNSPAFVQGIYLGRNTTCDQCPCAVQCPPGASQEQEPCGESLNDGCALSPPAFEPIASGETKCGTYYTGPDARDTDWYELHLAAAAQITITVRGENDMVFGLPASQCKGQAGCDGLATYLDPFGTADACTEGSLTTDCLQAGTYYIFVAPFYDFATPCRKDYYVTVTTAPCDLPVGACCLFPFGNCVDGGNEQACACQGGTFQGADTTCADVVCPVAPPGDSCENAIPIADPLPVVMAGNNCGYTDQYAAPCTFGAGGYDVVYAYTPTVDRLVRVSLCRDVTNFDTVLYVFAGDCHGAPIECNNDYCTTAAYPDNPLVSTIPELQLTAGVTYYIVVDGPYEFDCGDYELIIEDTVPCVVPCPPGATAENEACGGDTNGGCNSAVPVFEPLACGETVCGTGWFDGSIRDTDWYQLDIAAPTRVTLTVTAEFEVLLARMEQRDQGVPGCDNVSGNFVEYAVEPRCTPATITTTCLPVGTYYFFVAPQFTNTALCPKQYTLTATCEACAPPPNDVCSGAVPLTLGTPLVYDNSNADNDPADCGVPASRVRYGMWFSIVGDGTTFTATTCSPNTIVFDTLLSVYTDCNGGCLDGNDDAPCDFSFGLSTFSWCTTAGQTYYLLVGGYHGYDIGQIELTVTSSGEPCTLPPGETCENAIQVLSLPFIADGNTCGYLPNYDASCAGGFGSRDVVYAYTPESDQVVHVSLCNDPTDFDTVMYVYADQCGGDNEIACNDDTCSTASFPFEPRASDLPDLALSAGHTYYIVIDGYAIGFCGNYELTITSP